MYFLFWQDAVTLKATNASPPPPPPHLPLASLCLHLFSVFEYPVAKSKCAKKVIWDSIEEQTPEMSLNKRNISIYTLFLHCAGYIIVEHAEGLHQTNFAKQNVYM